LGRSRDLGYLGWNVSLIASVHRITQRRVLITVFLPEISQALTDTSQRNKNHPMIYSAKFHHTMFPNQYTALGKNNCATDVSEMFRNNDYYWVSGNDIAPGNLIPSGWTWGQAHANPQALAGKVCSYSL
jgi:hypothetical protein